MYAPGRRQSVVRGEQVGRDSPGMTGRPDAPGPVDRPERRGRLAGSAEVAAPLAPAYEPYQRLLDQSNTRSADTPREAIRGFAPDRANLEPISGQEAKLYVRENVSDRPWLNHAQYVGSDSCRLLAAVDKGGGHLLERHGSTVRPDMTEGRTTRLEDPAVAVDAARTPGRDAYQPEPRRHLCGDTATRIRDPHAFATCFARAVEHPDVRAVLDRPFDPTDERPDAVTIPLEELLGPDGHMYCDGHRLDPVNGNMTEARAQRRSWVDAVRGGDEPDVPEPTATRLQPEDFRGANVLIAFSATSDRRGWEIVTMYPDPVRRQ